jgi:hypothetical protein
VKDAVRTINRFEVRFALDGEAIQHSKELAATLRYRNFYQRSLIIEVLDQSGRKIHEEERAKNLTPPLRCARVVRFTPAGAKLFA